MNISEAIILEANKDIIGGFHMGGCDEVPSGILVAAASLVTLRNVCTNVGLIELEVLLQIRIDAISNGEMPKRIRL